MYSYRSCCSISLTILLREVLPKQSQHYSISLTILQIQDLQPSPRSISPYSWGICCQNSPSSVLSHHSPEESAAKTVPVLFYLTYHTPEGSAAQNSPSTVLSDLPYSWGICCPNSPSSLMPWRVSSGILAATSMALESTANETIQGRELNDLETEQDTSILCILSTQWDMSNFI